MSSTASALKALKSFNAKFEALRAVQEVLERIGNLEGVEATYAKKVEDLKKKVEAAGDDLEQARAFEGEAVAAKGEAEEEAIRILEAAQIDADGIRDRAKAEAAAVTNKARQEAEVSRDTAEAELRLIRERCAELAVERDQKQEAVDALQGELDAIRARLS